jgi:hypothetical protein
MNVDRAGSEFRRSLDSAVIKSERSTCPKMFSASRFLQFRKRPAIVEL